MHCNLTCTCTTIVLGLLVVCDDHRVALLLLLLLSQAWPVA
jgi:hypothetical protein